MKSIVYLISPVMGILWLAVFPELEASAEQDRQVLSGEAYYLERIALPPGAVLKVTLEDVSRMDVASKVIAESSLAVDAPPPYAFELNYKISDIDIRMRYSVRARILVGDRLRFVSTENVDPFADDRRPLRILMSSVSAPRSPASRSAGGGSFEEVVDIDPMVTLENTYWKLLTIGDRDISMAENQEREAFLQLRAEEGRVFGFGSCNRFTGTNELSSNSLVFGTLAAGQRACFRNMDVERAYFDALTATRYYSIHRELLTLLSTDRKPTATFVAVHF